MSVTNREESKTNRIEVNQQRLRPIVKRESERGEYGQGVGNLQMSVNNEENGKLQKKKEKATGKCDQWIRGIMIEESVTNGEEG